MKKYIRFVDNDGNVRTIKSDQIEELNAESPVVSENDGDYDYSLEYRHPNDLHSTSVAISKEVYDQISDDIKAQITVFASEGPDKKHAEALLKKHVINIFKGPEEMIKLTGDYQFDSKFKEVIEAVNADLFSECLSINSMKDANKIIESHKENLRTIWKSAKEADDERKRKERSENVKTPVVSPS